MSKLKLFFEQFKSKFTKDDNDNNNNYLMNLTYTVQMNDNKKYYVVQQRFIEFYNQRNKIFVLKNRVAGFSYIMQQIAIAENNDGKKVLYIEPHSTNRRKEFKGIDFRSGYNIDRAVRGKRYDVIIIDEAAWVKDAETVLCKLISYFPKAKIVFCTTPVKNENYEKIKTLFQYAEIYGNVFNFRKLKSVSSIKNLYNMHINFEEFISCVFGIFPDVEDENNEELKYFTSNVTERELHTIVNQNLFYESIVK